MALLFSYEFWQEKPGSTKTSSFARDLRVEPTGEAWESSDCSSLSHLWISNQVEAQVANVRQIMFSSWWWLEVAHVGPILGFHFLVGRSLGQGSVKPPKKFYKTPLPLQQLIGGSKDWSNMYVFLIVSFFLGNFWSNTPCSVSFGEWFSIRFTPPWFQGFHDSPGKELRRGGSFTRCLAWERTGIKPWVTWWRWWIWSSEGIAVLLFPTDISSSSSSRSSSSSSSFCRSNSNISSTIIHCFYPYYYHKYYSSTSTTLSNL